MIIFITMIGLEERVLGVFEKERIQADKYLLLINSEFQSDNRVNDYYRKITKRYLAGAEFTTLKSSYSDPFTIVREFNKFRVAEKMDLRESKVILDISTFNRQNLLVLLRMLRKLLYVPEIEIIYTIPQKVNQNLSKGAQGFANVPFFSGAFSIEKKKLLILLVGYEVDRPLLLWRELEPSRVILAVGDKPTSEEFLEPNRRTVEELRKIGPAQVVSISADDPFTARDQLSEIINKEIANYNIFVSPLNTKLQALGLYLAWESNPNVQIVIATPDKFSDWLTKGIKEVRRFKL